MLSVGVEPGYIEPNCISVTPASGNGRPLSLTTLPLIVPGFDTGAGEVCAIAGNEQSVAKRLAEQRSRAWEIIV